jgi:hypothetical protein
VHLITAHFVNREMVGPDLVHLRPRCKLILQSRYDADPAHFQDREWISSTYTRDGKTVFALLHDEYQGHTHPGACPSLIYKKCWYNAITLARSLDGGESFARVSSPSRLVASLPSPYEADQGPQGLFSPSNILYTPGDGRYYVFARLIQRGQRGSCLMRTRDLADPASWRAWSGSSFSVRFANPYQHEVIDPRAPFCQPVAPRAIKAMSESITFNTYFRKFLLVGTANRYERRVHRVVRGVYFSLSEDLIHWTKRRLIMNATLGSTSRCGDPNRIAYPSVLDPKSLSRNFETSGRRPYLFYTRFNYRHCRPSPDRDLMRVRLRFSK